MSEFASMLASFKKTASSTSQQQRPGSSLKLQQKQQSKKRPHSNNNSNNTSSANNAYQQHSCTPSFPSMHSNTRKYNNKEYGFELSFLVIGAQKAGTSWLHTLLQKCNQIALPRSQKEVHFWDWHHHKGFDWYINQFGFSQKRPADNTTNPLYGEITPCYVVLPPSTISEIHNCFPDLKIIFVARDLVGRAWSAMIMELRDQSMGLNAGEFGNGIIPGGGNNEQSKKRAKNTQNTTLTVAQQRRIQQQSSPSAQPDSYYLDRLRSGTHTCRSDYANHLKNWYRHFPSKNVLIIDFRDISSKPREVLLKIVMHIGVDEKDAKKYIEQLNDDDVQQRVNAATSNNTESKSPANQKASSVETTQHTLSERPRLRKQMEQYLNQYAVNFNSLLREEGYSWQLNEYK